MATKTSEATDAPAAVADTPPAETVEAPIRRRRGLRLGAIIGGGILAAALLFGGGVLLGTALPDGGERPGMMQGQLPGGTPPQGGFPGGEQPNPPSDDN